MCFWLFFSPWNLFFFFLSRSLILTCSFLLISDLHFFPFICALFACKCLLTTVIYIYILLATRTNYNTLFIFSLVTLFFVSFSFFIHFAVVLALCSQCCLWCWCAVVRHFTVVGGFVSRFSNLCYFFFVCVYKYMYRAHFLSSFCCLEHFYMHGLLCARIFIFPTENCFFFLHFLNTVVIFHISQITAKFSETFFEASFIDSKNKIFNKFGQKWPANDFACSHLVLVSFKIAISRLIFQKKK